MKEIKSAMPVNTRMIESEQPIDDIEKVLVVWTEDQMSHKIPLSQNLI